MIFVSTTGSITLFLLVFFFVRVVLSDDIEVRVFWLERGLRHVTQIGRGLAIVTTPLFDLVLRDLENTQILC